MVGAEGGALALLFGPNGRASPAQVLQVAARSGPIGPLHLPPRLCTGTAGRGRSSILII